MDEPDFLKSQLAALEIVDLYLYILMDKISLMSSLGFYEQVPRPGVGLIRRHKTASSL